MLRLLLFIISITTAAIFFLKIFFYLIRLKTYLPLHDKPFFSVNLMFFFFFSRNEPPIIPNQQPKKRRRKDLTKAHDETDDARTSNKQLKVAKMEVDKTAPVLGKVSTNPAQNLAMVSEYGDVKVQNQLNVSGISSKKKSTDVKMMLDPSSSSKVSNGNTSLSVADARNTEKLKTGVSQPKNVLSNKSKDANTSSDAVHQKYVDKSAYPQPNLQTGRQSNHVDEWEASVRQKEKSGARELPDVNASEGRYPMQTIVCVLFPNMHIFPS